MEVIVVIDGTDSATQSVLASIEDERLRVISVPQNVGGAEARNIGVQAARGEWIAFLDDDDEWLKQKVEKQILQAQSSNFPLPIVFSKVVARAPQADYVWPRRLPKPGESVGEYLFCRKSLFQGEGMIQTSSILARRSLLQIVPFSAGLKKHQDWDWVIRASSVEGVGLEISPEPLVIYYIDGQRNSVGTGSDWQQSLEWIQARRRDVTGRAYAAFVLIVVAAQAARTTGLRQYLSLFSEAFKSGTPRLMDIALFAGLRLVPRDARHRLRALLGGAVH
jgi:glycosyltransferase involved in cell wall biosynthesis